MAHRRVAIAGVLLAVLAVCLLVPSVGRASGSIAQAKARAAQLRGKIAALNGQMAAVVTHYDATAQRLSAVDAQIVANLRRLRVARGNLALTRSELAAQVVAMYKSPPTGFLDVALTATSFDDFVSGARLWDAIFRQGMATCTSISQLKGQIEQRGQALALDRRQVKTLLAQIAQQRAQVAADVQQGQTLLAAAQVRVKTLVKQMKARKAAAAAAAKAAAAAAARLANTGVAVQVRTTAGDFTPIGWAQALLGYLGMPVTSSNVTAVAAWELAEGGHWYNTAHYNPLDTTMPEPGASDMNSVGVKAYVSWAQGFSATVATLHNGLYGPILVALSKGDNAMAVAQAVAASPWGTGSFGV